MRRLQSQAPYHVEKILIRSPNWIGDQILAYPFFHFLRKTFPSAHIATVCVSWVKDLQYQNLVDEVFVLPKPRASTLLDRFRAVHQGANEIRSRGNWDLGIALPNSFSAGWLLFRAGAKRRRAYQTEMRSWLLNEKLSWDPDPMRHRSQAYLDLLPREAHDLTREVSAVQFFENEIFQKFDCDLAWPDANPVDPPRGDYWILAPGASADSRRWPLDRFVELAETIQKHTGWKTVIVGGPKEVPLVTRLIQDFGLEAESYAARGPVTCLWKVFQGAKLTVTNESGLAHFASLCTGSDKSMVQIVCGAADPRRTQPIGPGKVQVSVNAVSCWPCERNTCYQSGEKHLQCLRGISAQSVWEEIEIGLGRKTKTTEQS